MAGDFYDVGGFLDGRSTLRPFEKAAMGDVTGCRLVLRIEFLHQHPCALRARWPFMERRPDRTCQMPAGRPHVPILYSVKATRPAS